LLDDKKIGFDIGEDELEEEVEEYPI